MSGNHRFGEIASSVLRLRAPFIELVGMIKAERHNNLQISKRNAEYLAFIYILGHMALQVDNV